ncbi:MAG TPA: pyridoxal phosphate-dependent aminotransferase [Candidatus Tumulicola sp.]|nr:pyridoxal phosphate-dependent aminotransferase [Candidatus Tumulicola sp.]
MNPRVLEIPGSLIRRIAAKKRRTSIDLGLGEPSLHANPKHFEAALRYVREHGVKYTVNAGDPELRQAIAAHYAYPEMGRAENVCVTTGSQEATYVTLMTLLDPARDELLVVEPAFPSYAKMAALNGAACRAVEMREDEDFAFDAEVVLAAVGAATRAIVICSPCNPTARVLARDQADALVRGLSERRGPPVWLIHDEIYREQTFTGDAAELARLYPHTVVTNSLSKSNAMTGLRLGWLLGPRQFVEHAVKAHAWVTSCADTFAQRVALDVFTTGALREHLPWYREQRAQVVAALDRCGLRYVAPEGSFYACVRLPAGIGSVEAAEQLIERHDVVAIPGVAFGPALEGWLRLSWVAPAERVAEAIARIAAYCAESSAAR